MKTPIAIIHWECDAKITDPGPRVAHVFTLADLHPRNFFALKIAVIISTATSLTSELTAGLERACEELQRVTGAVRVALYPPLSAWDAQTWQPLISQLSTISSQLCSRHIQHTN